VRSAAAPGARTVGVVVLATLLAVAAGTGRGIAQESTPTPAPSPTPVVIPVPEIASAAEETTAWRRTIESTLQPTADVQAIDVALTERGTRIEGRLRDHIAALEAGPALRALVNMTAAWQNERLTLTRWTQTLTTHATISNGRSRSSRHGPAAGTPRSSRRARRTRRPR